MKSLMGGNAPHECNGRIAHCYGTQANCTGQSWGDCKVGESNCHQYCVRKDGSTYWL